MDEFDLYEIKQWGFPEWFGDGDCGKIINNLFIALSHNPHFMASNILYANFNLLENHFASWFILNKKTLFLYDKLAIKYQSDILQNSNTELQHFHYTRGSGLEFDKKWKYRCAVTRICQTQPMNKISNIPVKDLDWYFLAANPNKCVIDFLKKNRQNINWARLSENSSDAAVEYLLKQPHNIDWWYASSNTNKKLMVHFNDHLTSLSEYKLSRNPTDTAVQILLNSHFEISWRPFCKNPNDIAVNHIISIISQNRDDTRIVWSALCENQNPRVLDILRENKDKIVWANFVRNPICFSYNYEMMRKRCSPIKKEIEEIFLRPENVMAMIESYRNEGEEDFDVISRLNSCL